MGRLPAALKKEGLKARMLLQVHDELIFEVSEPEIEQTKAIALRTMENSFKINGIDISVPLVVEAGAGTSWAAAH